MEQPGVLTVLCTAARRAPLLQVAVAHERLRLAACSPHGEPTPPARLPLCAASARRAFSPLALAWLTGAVPSPGCGRAAA